MIWFWVLIGIVGVAVAWALIAGSGGGKKVDLPQQNYVAPEPQYNEPVKLSSSTQSWEDGAKASVSKNFGKGGEPTGISSETAGFAASTAKEEDDWLKNAKPFEPRLTTVNVDSDSEELETV